MYAGAQSVDDELRYADEDGSYTLIANAEYLLPVAHDYHIDIVGIPPLLDIVLDAVCIIDVEEATLRSPKDLGVVGNRLALSGGIDDRKHLLEVVEDELQSSAMPCHDRHHQPSHTL